MMNFFIVCNNIDNFTDTIVDLVEDLNSFKTIPTKKEECNKILSNITPTNFPEYFKKYGEPKFYIKLKGGLVLGWVLKKKIIFRVFNIIGMCDKKMTIYKSCDTLKSKDGIKPHIKPMIKIIKKYPAYKPNERIFIYSGEDKYFLINKLKSKKKIITIESLQEQMHFNKTDFMFKEKQIIIDDKKEEKEKKNKSFDKKLNKLLDVYGAPIFLTGDCKGNELLFFVKNYKGSNKNERFFDILIIKMDPYNKVQQVLFYSLENNKLEEYNVSY